MKKIIIWAVVVLIVIGGGWLISRRSGVPATSGETIKIGADFALSGNAARYGEWAKNGATLAVDKINREGGINGRNLELIFEDNKGETDDAVSAYQKLTKFSGANYVLTFLSSVALAISPLANSDQVVQMDISATTPSYSSPDDYTFRAGVVATQLASESAKILFDKLQAKRVVVLYINNDFGKGMLGSFKNIYSGEIIAQEPFEQNGFDFRTTLAKLKSQSFDYIFLVGHIKENGLLVKQARELGIKNKIFSDVYSIEGPEFVASARQAADGVIYVAPKFDLGNPDTVSQSFVSAYRESYQNDPTVFAAQSYDGVLALAEAMKACENVAPECVKDKLYDVEFSGASGEIRFDSNGDITKPVELKTIKDGKFVKLEP